MPLSFPCRLNLFTLRAHQQKSNGNPTEIQIEIQSQKYMLFGSPFHIDNGNVKKGGKSFFENSSGPISLIF